MAQVINDPNLGGTFGLATTGLKDIVINVVNVLLGFLGIIAVSIIIYGGFIWMTSSGAVDRVDKAKKILINGVIGLAIILASFAIVQFVNNRLLGGGGAGIPTGSGGSSSGNGALGGGIIESVYPAPGARDIPRNTSIAATFKEAMDPASIIADSNMSGVLGDWTDNNPANGLLDPGEYDTIALDGGDPVVKITKQADFGVGPYVTEVFASKTPDDKTFVFKPINPLGDSNNNTWHTAHLTDNILKANGVNALGAGGYHWSFEVNTFVDLTPPQVKSVQPIEGGTYAKNVVVQIQFSEAINPISVTNANITVDGSITSPIMGVLNIGNGYKTVEFLGSACGTNSCNETIYCLPGGETITVNVMAADCTVCPEADFPLNGIVDMANNALDGDKDGLAEGQAVDSYSWFFNTTNNLELTPPTIIGVKPLPGDIGVGLKAPVEVLFSELMMHSSLNSDSMRVLNPVVDFWLSVSDEGAPLPTQTKGYINHSSFGVVSSCKTEVNSGAKDLYQNCLWPSAKTGAPACAATIANPYCCDNIPSATPCP